MRPRCWLWSYAIRGGSQSTLLESTRQRISCNTTVNHVNTAGERCDVVNKIRVKSPLVSYTFVNGEQCERSMPGISVTADLSSTDALRDDFLHGVKHDTEVCFKMILSWRVCGHCGAGEHGSESQQVRMP